MTQSITTTDLVADLTLEPRCQFQRGKCADAASWVGVLSECRHHLLACDLHQAQTERDEPTAVAAGGWRHRACPSRGSVVLWRLL